ncbi:MAG TPA: 50S ribosomal protein L3 [Gemmatimonadaceae bacterium]|jgi:large subunit ribosomal protein L3|nr:50S ribosomal protein L3 [Gemmatimonadaceae bacterium]
MIGIVGRKIGMTQIFNEQGQQIPCTVIEAEPNPVVAVSDKAKVGYTSVQLGLGASRMRRESKKGEGRPKGHRASLAAVGHAKKAGLDTPPRVLRSVRLDEPGNAKAQVPTYNVGDLVKVDVFAVGDTVKVTGTSKGRGFQGIVKRHKAGGGPNTHGNTKHRRPGSIGPGTDPSRVIKGKRMPGHYGDERHTQISLRVEKIDTDRNLIYVRGSVAGKAGGVVVVRKLG